MLLAHDTGCVAGPRQTAASVNVSRADFDRAFDFFFGTNFCDGTCRTHAAAQGTGVFAIALGHDQAWGPESGHPGFGKGGVDDIGGADLHTLTATLAELKELFFGQSTGRPDQARVGNVVDLAVEPAQKRNGNTG